jgi:hypothetical protein
MREDQMLVSGNNVNEEVRRNSIEGFQAEKRRGPLGHVKNVVEALF